MTIATAVSGALELVTVGQEIYQQIANAMDAAEKEASTGADKKAWVLAYAKSLIEGAGENWDLWVSYVSDFIDAAKSIYNSLKGLFK